MKQLEEFVTKEYANFFVEKIFPQEATGFDFISQWNKNGGKRKRTSTLQVVYNKITKQFQAMRGTF